MTPDDLARLIEQYRAGIVAELNLLKQLAAVSRRQHDTTRKGDFGTFRTAADARDDLMRSLVMIEEGLRNVRQSLTEHRSIASRLPAAPDQAARRRRSRAGRRRRPNWPRARRRQCEGNRVSRGRATGRAARQRGRSP